LVDDGVTERLKEPARERQRFGYRRLTALLRREGRHVNHKRIYRLYRDLGLAMRRRKRKHSACRLATTEKTFLRKRNQRWAMDFLCDTLAFGRTFRILTIVDEHTRECLATEADTSLPGLRVIRVLEQLALTRGLPEEIHVDHGPEFVSRRAHEPLSKAGVTITTESAHIAHSVTKLQMNLPRSSRRNNHNHL
jgi:putative transposase